MNFAYNSHFVVITSLSTHGLMILGSWISLFQSQSSIQSTFSGLNQLQLILLLPLVGAYIPTKVVQFIAGVRIAVLLLSALNLSKSSSSCTNVNVGYSQSNSYLWLINIKNGSSLINCLNFVYMMLIIAGLHLVIFILVVLLRKVSDTRWIKKTICVEIS